VDVAFPPSIDFPVIGFDQPLTVFEGQIIVGARVQIAKARQPGPLSLPGHFRYQACNATACFPPKTLDTTWTLEVAAAPGVRAAQRAGVYRRADWAGATNPPVDRTAPPRPVAAAVTDTDVVAKFDRFTILGVTQYAGASQFLEFIRNAEAGVKTRGLFEGR